MESDFNPILWQKKKLTESGKHGTDLEECSVACQESEFYPDDKTEPQFAFPERLLQLY